MSSTEKHSWPEWETVRLIGRGSFGAVYEIQRKIRGRVEHAALKVISIPRDENEIRELKADGYDDESITQYFADSRERIEDEYAMMADLKGHSNVVYCDDIRTVQHDNGFGWDIYIKMELLNPLKISLGSNVADAQVIKLGMDICDALKLCEELNIVHRDIKPENIFISRNGSFKLGDFGIAKTMEGTTGGTKTGTYDYMAPEVYNNRPYHTQADIYSLGLVMYWLLNNRTAPFLPQSSKRPTPSAKAAARDRRFSGERIPAPKNGSEELQKIVLKACAFDPKDRYQSAREMREALARLAGQYPLELEPKPAPKPEHDPEPTCDDNETVGPNFGTVPSNGLDDLDKTVGPDFHKKNDTNSNRNAVTQKKAEDAKKKPWLIITAICAIVALIVMAIPRERNGWVISDGNKYYYQEGEVTTGFVTIENNRYLFDDAGIMQRGWQTIDDTEYYFNADGTMATGSVEIHEDNEKRVYQFDDDGILQYCDVTITSSLGGNSPDPISFSNVTDVRNYPYYVPLAEPVQNVLSMKIDLIVSEIIEGNPDGEWSVHIRSLTGGWQHIGYFEVKNCEGTFAIDFTEPTAFDAYTFVLDSDGVCSGKYFNALSEVTYRAYHQKQSLVETLVDGQGRTVQVICHEPGGNRVAWYTSEFDDGNVEQVRTIHDNMTGRQVTLTRNAEGGYDLTKEKGADNGATCYWMEYEYDTDGHCIAIIQHDEDGTTITSRTDFENDDAGNSVFSNQYFVAGDYTHTVRSSHEYNSEGMLISSDSVESVFESEYNTRITYKYDSEGNLLEQAWYDNDEIIPIRKDVTLLIENYSAEEIISENYEGIWNPENTDQFYVEENKKTYSREVMYDEDGRVCVEILWQVEDDSRIFRSITHYSYFGENLAFVYSAYNS